MKLGIYLYLNWFSGKGADLLTTKGIGLGVKPMKRALKVPPRPSTSGYLGDKNGPRGVSVLGCLQGPFAPAFGQSLRGLSVDRLSVDRSFQLKGESF